MSRQAMIDVALKDQKAYAPIVNGKSASPTLLQHNFLCLFGNTNAKPVTTISRPQSSTVGYVLKVRRERDVLGWGNVDVYCE